MNIFVLAFIVDLELIHLEDYGDELYDRKYSKKFPESNHFGLHGRKRSKKFPERR